MGLGGDRRSVLAGLGSAMWLAGSARATPASPSIITIPIELRHQRIVLPYWIDDKGPFLFFLDTGSPFYAIDIHAAHKAGLKSTVSAQGAGVTGLARRVDDFLGSHVVIGGVLRAENVVFTGRRFNEGDLVGLAPVQLLMLRPTDLDPAAGEIRIYETGTPDRSGYERLALRKVERWVNGATILHTGDPFPKLTIDIAWDGQPYRVYVDTGAPSALTLFASAVGRHGLWNKYPKWAEADGRGMYDAFRARIVRGQTLTVGSLVMKDPIIHLIDPSEPDLEREVDGLIGLDALRRLVLSVDHDNGALWIKPNGALHQAFRYNRSGIGFGRIDGRMGVASVAPGSPAAVAGVQPGDIILRPEGLGWSDFSWNLTDAPGTVIEFQVQRAGKVQPVRLVLAELI